MGCAVKRAGFPGLAEALAEEFVKLLQQDIQLDGLAVGGCKGLIHIVPALARYEHAQK